MSTIPDMCDQIIGLATQIKAQSGGTPTPPPSGGGTATGDLVKGKQPPLMYNAQSATFSFVAAPGTVQIDSAYTPAAGPYPGNNVTMSISDTPGGTPIVGPEAYSNGNSQGTIIALALTAGATYYVTIKRDEGGGSYAQYI